MANSLGRVGNGRCIKSFLEPECITVETHLMPTLHMRQPYLKNFFTQTEFSPLFYVSCFICNLDEVVTCDDVARNDPGYITVLDGKYF